MLHQSMCMSCITLPIAYLATTSQDYHAALSCSAALPTELVSILVEWRQHMGMVSHVGLYPVYCSIT